MKASELRQASYKGVPFAVGKWSGTRGQRREVFDYPGMNDSRSEAYGMAHRKWSIEAVITGEDWQERLAALLLAVETPEAGELILPDGSLWMAVADPAEYEVISVGEARVTLTLHEVTDVPLPEPEPIPASAVERATETSMARETNRFVAAFQRTRGWLRDARSKLERAQDAIRAAISPAEAEALLGELQALDAALWALSATPSELARRWRAMLKSVGTLPTARLLADLFAEEATASTGATPSDSEKQSVASHDRLRWAAAVERWSQVAAETKWTVYDATLEALNDIGKHLDALETDEPTWSLVRAALTDGVLVRSLRLPRLKKWIPPDTMAARLIAWRLYGDAERASEIVDRNGIEHAGFVPGGRPILVLER